MSNKRVIIGSESNDDRKIELELLGATCAVPVVSLDASGDPSYGATESTLSSFLNTDGGSQAASGIAIGGNDGTNFQVLKVNSDGELITNREQNTVSTADYVQITDGDKVADVIECDGHNAIVALSPGHISTLNSTDTPLGISGVFTGSPEDTTNFGVIVVTVISDKASATDGLSVQFSCDRINWDCTDVFTVPAATSKTYSFQTCAKFFRVVYTNSASAQTYFRLHVQLKPYYVKPSSHRIADSIIGEDDAELTKAVLTGLAPDTTFKNVLVTNAGEMKMSIQSFDSAVSSNSDTQLNVTQFDSSGNELFNSAANRGYTQITDGTDSADVETLSSTSDNLDEKKGLVTASAMYGRTDDIVRPVQIDAATHSLIAMNYEHHEIHEGSHYFVSGYQDLAINNVLDFTWLMPNTTKWTHWRWTISTESETLWQVYEGVTATNPLANAVTPYNSNRNSANTSGTTMKYEKQADLAAANADTNVAAATLLSSGISGAGKESGREEREDELIMKQNTLYCLRATANTAGFINFNMRWYEITDKN